jgi:hypothetical protein
MVVTTPNTSMKGTGLDAYGGSNTQILKQNLESILKEGYLSTFMFGDGEYGEDMANNFAKTIADPLSKAIESYVANMIKSQNILITPAALVSPVGPVSGTMSTMVDITIM